MGLFKKQKPKQETKNLLAHYRFRYLLSYRWISQFCFEHIIKETEFMKNNKSEFENLIQRTYKIRHWELENKNSWDDFNVAKHLYDNIINIEIELSNMYNAYIGTKK